MRRHSKQWDSPAEAGRLRAIPPHSPTHTPPIPQIKTRWTGRHLRQGSTPGGLAQRLRVNGLVQVEFHTSDAITRLTPRGQRHCGACLGPPGGLRNRATARVPRSARTLHCRSRRRSLRHLSPRLPSYRRGRPAAESESQRPVVNSPHSFLTEK